MKDLEKYDEVFRSIFELSKEEPLEDFSADSAEKWDSVTHLSLITALEDEFDLMLDSEDILGLRSYEQGKEILSKHELNLKQ